MNNRYAKILLGAVLLPGVVHAGELAVAIVEPSVLGLLAGGVIAAILIRKRGGK